jgi:hypothetical protein
MVLQHAAVRSGAARDTDLVAQGGDEFLVLLADLEVASEDDEAEPSSPRPAPDRVRSPSCDLPSAARRCTRASAARCSRDGDARTLLRLADEKIRAQA